MQGAGHNGIDLSRTPAQIFNDIALSGRCSALITVTRESKAPAVCICSEEDQVIEMMQELSRHATAQCHASHLSFAQDYLVCSRDSRPETSRPEHVSGAAEIST